MSEKYKEERVTTSNESRNEELMVSTSYSYHLLGQREASYVQSRSSVQQHLKGELRYL